MAGAGVIAVAPSSIGSAAAAGAALAAQLAAMTPHALAPGAIANSPCFQAFSDASRLVGEALQASAASLDEIARALHAAAGAYALADQLAVAPE